MVGIAYLPVAFGSPGPFDKKIPFGLYSNISPDEVFAGTTITFIFNSSRQFKIFCFIP